MMRDENSETMIEAATLYDWLRHTADELRAGDDPTYDPTPEDLERWAEALADLAYPRADA